MIEYLPAFINWLFILTTLLTAFLFLKAVPNYKSALIMIAIWLIIQAFIGLSGFYTIMTTVPPRFGLLVLPPLLLIAGLFITPKGKIFIDSLDAQWLTWLHIVRIPVEITLFWLFLNNKVPAIMTFEGRNFDILSGLSAPLIAWYGYTRARFNKTIVLAWNLLCLGLLLNIVVNAVLSLPTPFQQFALDHPNIALLYFPFVWLPCFIVPLVLFAHLACIRRLFNSRN